MATEKQIIRIGPFQDLIASCVRLGDVVTFSGQVAVDKAGAVIGSGDVVAQLEQAYTNLQEVLAELGVGADRIIDETWFVTDAQDVMTKIEALMRLREDILGVSMRDISHTLVQVTALVDPDLLIEVKCVARL